MADREKVIKGLECHQIDKDHRINCSDCPYHCDEFMNGLNELHNDAIAMLKEQETVEPKKGHWIFESAYCEAWSHTCSECGKRMTTAYNTYANYCWNCGAKMEGR